MNFSNPFSLEQISRGLGRLEDRQDRVYLGVAAFFTGLGYFLLALLPLLAIVGVFKVLGGISAADSLGAWLNVLLWIAITAVSGLVTLTMLRVKNQMPSGLGVKEDKAPRLYELINELGETYKLPTIHKVIIHDHCDVEMVSVPRFGLPIFNINVLYIGLPAMQCLAPIHFKGALARKLGQYSAQHNRLTHWIYRWRQYCAQYLRTYKRSSSPLHLPLRYFFQLYTPLMNAVTVHAARRDELEGDVYAMQIMNDEELADVILRFEVCRTFLKNKYWPKIYSMLRKQPDNPEHLPHINMPTVLRKALTENEFAQTMKELINAEPDWQTAVPGLHARLEHIGQTKLNMPPPVMETAAQRYLGDAFSAVVKLLDKQWFAKHGKSGKKRRSADSKTRAQKKTQPDNPLPAASDPQSSLNSVAMDSTDDLPYEEKQYQSLLTKVKSQALSHQETFELATLTEKFKGKAAAINLYQKILKSDPNHAQTIFAIGRILLSQNDQSGVKILEKAMQLDKGCIAQACWMLAKYFKATGDEARAKKYLERAANVSAAA